MVKPSHILVSLLRERGGNPLEADQIIDFETRFADPSRFHPGHNIHSVADQQEDAEAATPYAGDPMAGGGGGGGGMPPPAAGEMGAPGAAPPEDSELTDMNTVPPEPGGGGGGGMAGGGDMMMGQQPGQPPQQIPGMQESRIDERMPGWGGVMPHAFMGGHGGGFHGFPGGGGGFHGFPGMPRMPFPMMRPPPYGTAGQYPNPGGGGYQGPGGGGGGYPGALPPVRPNIPQNPDRRQQPQRPGGQPAATGPAAAAGPVMSPDIDLSIPHYGTEPGGDPFKKGADNTPNPFKNPPPRAPGAPGAPTVPGGVPTGTATSTADAAAEERLKAAAAEKAKTAPPATAAKTAADNAATGKALDAKYGDMSTHAARHAYFQDQPASRAVQNLPYGIGTVLGGPASWVASHVNAFADLPDLEHQGKGGIAPYPTSTPAAAPPPTPDKPPAEQQNSSREYTMPRDYFSLAEDVYDRFLNELLQLDEAPPSTADLNRQELARVSGGAQQTPSYAGYRAPTYDYYSAPGVGQRFDGGAAPAASDAAAPAGGGGGGARPSRAPTGGGGRAAGGGGARRAGGGAKAPAIPEVPTHDIGAPPGSPTAATTPGAAKPFTATQPPGAGGDEAYTRGRLANNPAVPSDATVEKTGPYGAIGDVVSSVYNAMPTIFPSRNPAVAAAKPPAGAPATNPAAAPNLVPGGVLKPGTATNPAVASAPPTPPPGGLVAGGALGPRGGTPGLQQPQPPRPTVTQNPGAAQQPAPSATAPAGGPPTPSGSAGLDTGPAAPNLKPGGVLQPKTESRDWKMTWNDFMVLSESEKKRR